MRNNSRQGTIFPATIAALLAITINAVVPPGKIVNGAIDSVGDHFRSQPSAAQREVDAIYAAVEESSSWRSSPVMSLVSKEFLVENWDRLRPDEIQPFPHRAARWRTLEEVFDNYSLDGHQLFLTVFVDQVTSFEDVPGHPDRISVAFRMARPDKVQAGWCTDTVFPRGEEPAEDQMVTIAATPVARGSAVAPDGSILDTTYFVCSAVNPVVDVEPAQAVARLFEHHETGGPWEYPPAVSAEARHYLLYHWDEATPYEVHPFPLRPLRYLSLERLFYDTRFDHGMVRIAGFVVQQRLVSQGDGKVFEQVRLEVRGEDNGAWCDTTVQGWRVFREGEYVEAVGVPVARGSSPLSSGGFTNQTFLVCPAMRRVAPS